jgi:hypothetical protein
MEYLRVFKIFWQNFGFFQTSEILDSKYESDGEGLKSQHRSYLYQSPS